LGGATVSSTAQNGIDQTKSADVPVCRNPGIPWKIGGLLLKLQYQAGSIGPSGRRWHRNRRCWWRVHFDRKQPGHGRSYMTID
jgi:hypothetical protein